MIDSDDIDDNRTPNLFGQMPNLMDNLLGGAAPAPGPAASLAPSCCTAL